MLLTTLDIFPSGSIQLSCSQYRHSIPQVFEECAAFSSLLFFNDRNYDTGRHDNRAFRLCLSERADAYEKAAGNRLCGRSTASVFKGSVGLILIDKSLTSGFCSKFKRLFIEIAGIVAVLFQDYCFGKFHISSG